MFLQAASETGQGVPSALIALRASPITALCLGICMALPVVCAGQTWNGVRWGDTQREWGAAVNLQRIIPGSLDESPDLRLVGPFDLWNGDWWRIPCNAFHHVGFLHFTTNPCLRYHIANHLAWLTVHEVKAGQIMTGWARYDHYATHCELLPVSLPRQVDK